MASPEVAARIADIKPVPAQVQLLAKQLQSDDPGVRKAGLDSIVTLKAPVEPLTDLIAKLLEHQNWFVRKTAAAAAVEAAKCEPAWEVSTKEVVGPRMISSDGSVLRTCQSAILGIIATADAEEDRMKGPSTKSAHAEDAASAAVLEAATRLSNPDAQIRFNAVESLSRMGGRAAPHASSLGALLGDPDLSVRNAVIRSFTRLSTAAAGGAEEAGKQLLSKDPALRRSGRRALLALAEHSGEVAAAATAAQLTATDDAVNKRCVLESLLDMGALAVPHGEVLAKLMEDADVGIRHTVVRVMIEAGPGMASSLKHIKARLEHSDATVQRTAVDCMRGLAPLSAPFAEVVGRILRDGLTGTMQQRIQILEILGGAEAHAEPFLKDIALQIEAPDWAVRRAAIEALSDLGEHAAPVAVEVAKRLMHFDPDIRRSAAEALGRMGIHSGKYAYRLLGMLEHEEDDDVRNTCQMAVDIVKAVGALDDLEKEADEAEKKKAEKKKGDKTRKSG